MSYKYNVLSLQERGELLQITILTVLIGAMFFGTSFLINQLFPGMPLTVDFGFIGINQSFSPGSAVFVSLAGLCLIISLAILGTAIFNTLAFLYIPIILICLIMIGQFIKSFLATLAEGNLIYDLAVLGILCVQIIVATILIKKVLDRFDLRNFNTPY